VVESIRQGNRMISTRTKRSCRRNGCSLLHTKIRSATRMMERYHVCTHMCQLPAWESWSKYNQIMIGGNLVHYPSSVGTRTADLLTVNLLLNSIISTPGARFMSLDINNFYFMAPMTRYKYARMNLTDFPEEMIEEYKSRCIATPNGCVIAECRKCVYDYHGWES
jgi:hypothetical protein